MKKKKVVLYNPDAVFYTMPLALIAIGSYLDPEKYEVKIIDARLEKNVEQLVFDELQDAICFGTTVLTGAPIKDALQMSKNVKAHFPRMPVIWGGWHPSLFPEDTAMEDSIDIVVRGQGELTFSEILHRLEEGKEMDGVLGVTYKKSGKVVSNEERPLKDINEFPAFNYNLIRVKEYEALSGRKQIDYISSQGCRFRCNFCADPFMYKRGWYGYSPQRLADELEGLWKQYHFEHVHFQDETFFTNSKRVIGISEEFIKRGLNFSWFGTMRADQGQRLDEDVFSLCKKAGLERVMVGVESGSQRMLDWMKKDIKVEQIFETARKCVKYDIAINFSVIIGFPTETQEDMMESLRVVRELRKMSPRFHISIFYFKPYPGNEIADMLLRENYRFPKGINEWSDFDFVGQGSRNWINNEQYEIIEGFKFYQRVAWSKPNPVKYLFQQLAKWRCEHNNYNFPIEKVIYEKLRPQTRMS